MSEKERDVIKTICEAIPKMSDFDKGYLLGRAEEMHLQEKQEAKEQDEKEQ